MMKQRSVIARHEAISKLYRAERWAMDKNIVTYLRRDCFVPRNDVVVKFTISILICVFITVNAVAHGMDTTIKKSSVINSPEFITRHPLLVVDGKVYEYDSLKNINTNAILIRDTLKSIVAAGVIICKPDFGAIIIVTKKSAINRYQEQFGKFSKSYREYLKQHQNNDIDFLYVLNGIPVQGSTNDVINSLYKISPKKIISLSFMKKSFDDRDRNLVIIRTKQ